MLQDSTSEQVHTIRRNASLEVLAELIIALVFLIMGIAALLESATRKQQ